MKWTPGILFDFIRESPGGAVDSRKSKQMFKMAIFSLAPRPEGPVGGLLFGIFM